MMEKLQTHGNLLIFSRLFSPQVFKIALFFFGLFVCSGKDLWLIIISSLISKINRLGKIFKFSLSNNLSQKNNPYNYINAFKK